MQLYYRTLGESGRPLLILHGLFGSSDNWLTISKEFAKGYKVYILDQRNHGQSPHSPEHSYAAMAADLKEFIETHQLENPAIIGHSMGGKAVIKFATTYPEVPVYKIVVVDISPRAYPPHHQMYISAMQSIDLAALRSRQDAENVFIENGVSNIGERQFLMKNLYRDEDGAFKWKINLPGLIDQINNIGEGTPENTKCLLPTLFIKGENSHYYINQEDVLLIQHIFPNSIIKTIANSGHWVQAEQPVEFYKTVTDFLES